MKIGLTSERAQPDRHVDDRLLEGAASASSACPGVAQVAHLGRAAAAAPRPGRPGEARRERRLARAGHGRPPPTRSTPALLQYSDGAVVGTGGFVETGGQRLNIRTRAADHRPRGPRQGARRASATARCCAWPTWATSSEDHQPIWGDARHQRRPRPDADRPEVPRGQHDGGHARASRTRWTRCAPGLPGIEVDTTIFRPATFIEQSIDNLTTGAAARHPAGDPDHRRLPVRVAHGVHQPDRDPAVAGRRGRSCSTCAASTINVMVLAGLVVAIGVVVDDAIIDVENIVRRLRQARADGDRRSRPSGSCSTPRWRCGRAITYATLINVVAVVPVLLPRGPVRLLLPAAGAVLRAGGAGLDGRRADGHAGAVPAVAVAGTARRTASRRCCGC